MSETIVGLQIDIPGRRVKELIDFRIAWHEQQRDHHMDEAKRLETLMANDSSIGPTDCRTAENRGSYHMRRALYLTLLSEHIVADAVYRLSEDDLDTIEATAR